MADTQTQDRLVPLGELNDYQVAPGNADIRGWSFHGVNDANLGKVKELIVDTSACKARFLVAAVGGGALGFNQREVLIPLAEARLDTQGNRVYLDNVSEADLGRFPQYDRANLDRDEKTWFGAGSPVPAQGQPQGQPDLDVDAPVMRDNGTMVEEVIIIRTVRTEEPV